MVGYYDTKTYPDITYLVEGGIKGDYEFTYTPTWLSTGMVSFSTSPQLSKGEMRKEWFIDTYSQEEYDKLPVKEKLVLLTSEVRDWKKFKMKVRWRRLRSRITLWWWKITGKFKN